MNIHLKLEEKLKLGNVIRFITCPIMSFFPKKKKEISDRKR